MTNTEKLIKAIEEKREEIIEKSKSIYKDSMTADYFQGWNIGLIIDTDGDINDFYRNTNTSSIQEYEGTSIAVINYNTCQEVEEISIDESDLTQEEQDEFKQWLLDEEKIEDIDEWELELNYNNLYEFDSEIIERLETESAEYDTENYYYEVANIQIDDVLENLQIRLQNEIAE